jgi:anaerobic selenocysteine-containing dehydrogenase
MTAKTHQRYSPIDQDVVISMCGVCPAGCGVEVHLVDGKIDHLTPLKDHPQGGICPRGMAASEIVYSPDRLLYPLKRVGERGAGRFERITWDQAFDQIVAGFKEIAGRHGPQAVAIYTGRGNFEFGSK